MARRFTTPVSFRLRDRDVDQVARNLDRRVRELAAIPFLDGELTREVELPNATEVPIPHGLGRIAAPFVSPVRDAVNAGRVEEVISDNYDREKYIVLKATGFGATVTTSVWVL